MKAINYSKAAFLYMILFFIAAVNVMELKVHAGTYKTGATPKKRRFVRKKKTETKKPDMQEQLQVYLKNKENLLNSYKLVKAMSATKNNDEFLALAEKAGTIFKQTQATLKAIKTGIPDLKKFTSENADAKMIKLYDKVSALNSNFLSKAQIRFADTVKDLKSKIEKDLAQMKNPESIYLAAKAFNRIKNNLAFLKKIAGNNNETAVYAQRAMKQAQQFYVKILKKVAEARMPIGIYIGCDREQLRNTLKRLFRKKYPNDKLKRLVIHAPEWQEQVRPEIDKNGEVKAKYYKYLPVLFAAKQQSGCIVHSITFRKAWNSDAGKYEDMEISSVGTSYPILEENINK